MRFPTPTQWDALVIGGGPAGVVASEQLRSRGYLVGQLELGPWLPEGTAVPEVSRRQWPYATVGQYDWYRVRAAGGRSLVWGGWCFRFPESTLGRSGWPVSSAEFAPAYEKLERKLGVVEGVLDERYRTAAEALEVKIVPKRGIAVPQGVTTAPRMVPTRAQTLMAALRLEHEKGRAEAVQVFDLRAETLRRVRARTVLLCASPVETARILLESDLGPRARNVGRGFVDHMVASYILLEPAPPPPRENRGPFPGAALVESFVNLDDQSGRPYPGGFSIELSGPASLTSLSLERMAPPGEEDRTRATLIHAIGETTPHPDRFVDLDPNQRDITGRFAPRIHIAFSNAEEQLAEDMRKACLQLADSLAMPGSRVIPFLDPLQAGAGHEAGTCSMGFDESSPTDPHGRLRALDNVWVADASALPTPGDRHPTLTVLAHALRAADDAARFLERAKPKPAKGASRKARHGQPAEH